MIEEEIKEAKNNYKRLLIEQKKALEIQKRINELKENPYVKEFLDLQRKETEIISPDANLAFLAFDMLAKKTKKSEGLYVYVGSSEYFGDYYRHYCDLETRKLYTLPKETAKEFEESYDVILPFDESSYVMNFDGKTETETFEQIRNDYFKDLLTTPKEECIKKLSKRFKNSWKDN